MQLEQEIIEMKDILKDILSTMNSLSNKLGNVSIRTYIGNTEPAKVEPIWVVDQKSMPKYIPETYC